MGEPIRRGKGHLAPVIALVIAVLLPALGVGIFISSANASLPVQAVRVPGAPSSTSLVISQVYGGGGNAGAPYQNDYIEIFNPTNTAVDLTGWSVQYTSAAGSTWSKTDLSGSVAAGGYYLVQEAVGVGCSGSPCGLPLPTPDKLGTIAMSGTAGKVALVSSGTLLTGTCPTGGSLVDFVGFGTTANCSEGAGPAPAPSNTTADLRAAGGCQDTDQNAADFSAVAPNPRNSASPLNPCGGGSTPTNSPIPPSATSTDTATAGPSATDTATPTQVPGSGALRISQVYGGGGNTGATYQNDFVELFNPTNAAVSITGWTLHYASSGGSGAWTTTALSGSVAPYSYFLVQLAAGNSCSGAPCGVPLPTADLTGTLALGSTAGKVALVPSTVQLSGICPDATVADLVGYGGANCFEGTGPTGVLSNSTAAIRNGDGCVDTNQNSSDFTVGAPNPRNSSSPQNMCPPPTATQTPTITPTGTPPTATASATIAVGGEVQIYMLYTMAYTDTQGDEAVRLINVGTLPAAIGGWQITSEAGGAITLPLTTTINAGQKLWVAKRATSFTRIFGFRPDYEFAADTDPLVPQAASTSGFAFGDAGGAVQLLNAAAANQDTLVYGTGSVSTPGWLGTAVPYYLPAGQPDFTSAGQILYRKLDEYTGRPVADTNTDNDWAQDRDPSGASTPVPGDRENDDVNGKKLLRPGWALTNPAYEDMFFTKVFTENATTKFLVDPDNSFQPIRDLILGATQSITIETYEWHNAQWVQDIIDAKNRGVQVTIALEGNPCCNVPPSPDDETLWSAQQWENAGIPVYFFSGYPGTTDDNYRYNNVHAKIMLVDNQWVVTGADNFTSGGMPNDPKGNGTAGNRGTMIMTNAPSVVAYTARLLNFDIQPGKYADMVRWGTVSGFGPPPPGYAPTPIGDRTGYMPVKPTPLVVTETERIEIVQSPDNPLRDVDSLIGLVDKAGAGDEVMVEQQYERKYWETSITDGPNVRLQAYIRAAQRGANVRILLDGYYEGVDCTSQTHNPATVAYVNGFGLANLQAKVAEPTGGADSTGAVAGNIHNKMVLVSSSGTGYVHSTSINGSLNSSKNNREYGLQVQSNAAFQYYKDVFNYDWSQGYLPCVATPTPTGVAPTATPWPSPTCNLLANAGFESGQLAPWAITTPGITASVTNGDAYSGSFSVAVTSVFTAGNGGSQGLEQGITNIVAGQTYRVGAAVKRAASNIASARIRVTWYPCPTPGGCGGTNADMFLGSNNPSWQYFNQYLTAPAGTLSAKFKPVFYTSDGNPATIYFDDLVFDCNGSGTATPTATSTATVAPSPTATDTAQPSNTATQTPVPSSTSTAVPTSTATHSATATSSATSTATTVPSNTSTGTATASPTSSATSSATATITATSTATSTAASTATTTSTATRTATTVPSNTSTRTATSTATQIPTGTSTQTGTSTPIPTSTGTSTATAMSTQPPTSTHTTTATTTGTQTATLTRTSTITGTTTAPPSSTSTNTSTSTATATATPTACTINFADVPPAHTFYPWVQCLACDGVINGYPCGGPGEPCNQNSDPYFRPGAIITRAQIAKIVALAAGITTPVPLTQQTFEDVTSGSTFWLYIEQLAGVEAMGGYPCGGPGEPCVGPSNRPYFRQSAPATRGQLTKIVSQTASYHDTIPSGTQTFADVPEGSTFYDYAERLLIHNPFAMSGYACGGAGEPCDPQQRPYFRPANNVTRGQASKIVASIFYPACESTR